MTNGGGQELRRLNAALRAAPGFQATMAFLRILPGGHFDIYDPRSLTSEIQTATLAPGDGPFAWAVDFVRHVPGERLPFLPPGPEHQAAFELLFEEHYPGAGREFWRNPEPPRWGARVLLGDGTKTVLIPLQAMEFLTGAEILERIGENLLRFFAQPGRRAWELEWRREHLDFIWHNVTDREL